MYKKKMKCGHCGNAYYWEETTIESTNKCSKCRKYSDDDMMEDEYDNGHGKWKDKKDKKDKHDKDNKHDKRKDTKGEKHDRNEWIRDLLNGKFDGRRIAIFTEDGTHTLGTVDEVERQFVKLVSTEVPHTGGGSGWYSYTEPVKVKSDKNKVLEKFDKYFIRLDSIVGFGEPINNGGTPCASGSDYDEDEDYMDDEE